MLRLWLGYPRCPVRFVFYTGSLRFVYTSIQNYTSCDKKLLHIVSAPFRFVVYCTSSATMTPAPLRSLTNSWFSLPNTSRDQSKEADSLPLLGDDDSVTSMDSLTPPNEEKRIAKSFRNYTFIFNIALTIFNVALVLYAWQYLKMLPLETSFYPVHKLTHRDIAKLRRPSQWINLEKMYENMRPQPRTFTNWPLVLAPIDPDHPNHAFGNGPKRHRTLVGLVSPEDREFRVSEKVHPLSSNCC
jgi:hypothetical protein